MPANPVITITTAAKLDFSWGAPTGDTNALGTDKVTFVVYNESKNKFVRFKARILRSALALNLQLSLDWSGDEVQAYLSLVSADGELVSDSVHVGSFTVL